ncbi:MAG: hypothetical protein U7127_23865 [Phormidium sp.]
MQLYNSQLATMLEIHKNIVLDENQQPIAVQIPIAEFEKIEEILEDYGLAKLIKESENEERLSKEEALQYYKFLKGNYVET